MIYGSRRNDTAKHDGTNSPSTNRQCAVLRQQPLRVKVEVRINHIMVNRRREMGIQSQIEGRVVSPTEGSGIRISNAVRGQVE
jgi:hypothetical protein